MVNPSMTSNFSDAKLVPPIPFKSIKYNIEVKAMPPNKAATQVGFFSKLKESSIREINCTMAPTENAITTDNNMPKIIWVAFDVFI